MIRAKIIIFILPLLLFSCAGLKKERKDSPARQKETVSELTFLFTNATHGKIEPEGCGCRQQGGLSRRAGLIQKVRKSERNVLVFDTGNIMTHRDAFPDKEKTVYFLIALNKMKIDALNVGAIDAVQARFLKQKEDRLVFPLISANIRSLKTRDRVFTPFIVRETAGVKTGIFGLTGRHRNPNILQEKGLFIDDPVKQAAETVNRLAAQNCDIIILLSQLSNVENAALAAQIPGIDFIFGSAAAAGLKNITTVKNTVILSPGTGGKKAALVKTRFRKGVSGFYNIDTRKAVANSVNTLKNREKNPEDYADLENIVLKRKLMEEKLLSFRDKNGYRCEILALDKNIAADDRVSLVIEKYKLSRLRKTVPDYNENIPGIDLSTLPERKQLLALRLLNDIKCHADINIASSATLDPFCRRLSDLIINSIKAGKNEGEIRYRVIREKNKNKKSLDKNFLFQ